MENIVIVLIVITLLLLIIIVGLLTFLLFKVIKQNPIVFSNQPESTQGPPHPDVETSQIHPSILERMKDLDKIKSRRVDLFCPNHPDEPGETTCAICDKMYCKSCIKPFKTLHFCKEHLPLVMRFEWEEVLTIKTSTSDPEQGVRLYDLKKDIFEKEGVPTYIETHYKINVDQDYIETYLVLFSTQENLEDLKKKFRTILTD